MKSCREFEAAIDLELAEGLAAAEHEQLLDHLDRCDACSELFDLLTALKGDTTLGEPSEHELARMRRRLMGELPGAGVRPTARRVGRWTLAAAAAVALVGGGWLAGRSRPVGPAVAALTAAEAMPTPAELRRAGYRFASATVEERGADRLRLSFDVARTIELDVDRNDPLVTEVLVQSLASPAALGSRLRAVESAAERLDSPLDPRVRDALIEVMRRDESVAVRLAAQEKLLANGGDPAVADALLDLLASEESVQMRLAAIDSLTENAVDAGRLARAIEAGETGGERAMYVRAGHYLSGRAVDRPGSAPHTGIN